MISTRSSRGRRWALGLLLLIAVGLGLSGTAGATSAAKRIGSKPTIPAGAQRIGALAGTTSVQAVVTLQPRDPQALAAYAEQVSTPGTSAYHRYLSVAQFVARFGPTAGQVRRVAAALRARGLSPGTVSANHLALQVTAPATRLASAFSTSFDRYRLASGRTAYANTAAPAVPSSVAGLVQGVVGLSTLAVPRPLSLRRAAGSSASSGARPSLTASASAAAPCTAARNQASADGSYTADQIASAYGLTNLYSSSDFGSGATVALYELEPYSSADLAQYQSCYGTSASVTNVSVDGGAGAGSGSGEAALDVEDVVGLAPQANVRVYEGPNTNSGAYDTYSRIISENLAQVISTSWGLCESAEGSSAASAENTLFQEAAVQGQSIFAAAGDDGTADCVNVSGKPIKQRAVDDPASQPYVTGVGGTSMTAIGPPPTETVWNNGYPNGAGGGGVSTLWAQPSYQAGFAQSQSAITCGASTTCREVPDVTASADQNHGYAIYYGGGWTAFGGTSVAAPTWAALTALANASASCVGTQVGFANPALYRAASDHYGTDFNDITSGTNSYDTVTGFSASTGYDMASGLGSPKGGALAADMCGNTADTVAFTNAPGNQSSTVGTPVSVSSSATSSSGPVTYSASNLPPGLSINSTSGTISGTPTQAGTYPVTERAVDSSFRTATTSFTWVVNPASGSSSTTTTTTTSSGSTSSPAKVSVTPIAAQSSHAGSPQSLPVSATDSRGLRLTYSAGGLPPGLSINSGSGLISGRPTKSGVYSVTVTARDTSGASGSTSFRWTIAARPSVAKHSLRLRGGRPQLVLKVKAGSYAPAVRSVTVRPRSRAVRLSGKRSALRSAIVATAGSRLKLSNRAVKGSLTVAVVRGRGAAPVTLTISAPELGVSSSVLSKLLAHRGTGVRLTLVVKDITGFATTLGVRL